MNVSNRQRRGGLQRPIALLLAAAVVAVGTAGAQESDRQLPITVFADYADIDRSMLVYRGLRLMQGNISIQADRGRTSNLEAADSVWHLAGNVVIDTLQGHLESETADITFEDNELKTAVVTGSPATFRMQRPDSETTTYAEAGRFVYDPANGIVEFSQNATITEGGNQISSEYLVYNIREQRIKAQSGGTGDSKVRTTYTPENPEDAVPENDAEDASAPDDQDSPDEAGGR